MLMRLISAAIVLAVLSACGFHLRGNIPLPESLKVMAVQSNEREVHRSMTRALSNAGVEVVGSADQASALLDLYNVKYSRTVRTIDDRGKVTGYNLEYRVNFRVTAASGEILRESSVLARRDFNFDPDLVLQNEIEENSLREDMLLDVTQSILRQLATVTAAAPAAITVSAFRA